MSKSILRMPSEYFSPSCVTPEAETFFTKMYKDLLGALSNRKSIKEDGEVANFFQTFLEEFISGILEVSDFGKAEKYKNFFNIKYFSIKTMVFNETKGKQVSIDWWLPYKQEGYDSDRVMIFSFDFFIPRDYSAAITTDPMSTEYEYDEHDSWGISDTVRSNFSKPKYLGETLEYRDFIRPHGDRKVAKKITKYIIQKIEEGAIFYPYNFI